LLAGVFKDFYFSQRKKNKPPHTKDKVGGRVESLKKLLEEFESCFETCLQRNGYYHYINSIEVSDYYEKKADEIWIYCKLQCYDKLYKKLKKMVRG